VREREREVVREAVRREGAVVWNTSFLCGGKRREGGRRMEGGRREGGKEEGGEGREGGGAVGGP